ncbi:MAG: DNA repair protein RecN, partial [Polyangiales bacterium]
PGEEEVLAQTRERARHGEQLAHATAAAEEALYASDGALSGQLARLAHDIERVAAWDPALKDSAQKLQEASVLAEEAARDLGHYARQLHFDPEVLERSEERWTRLQQLKRKHGGSLEAVLAYAEQARQALAEMQDDGARRETLRGEVEALRLQAGAAAQVLSQKRHKAAVGLGQAVSRELRELGMGGARVEVQVAPLPAGEHDAFSFEGARLSRTGIDRAELCIAPNRGEAPQPLAKIASGGELSRALLGIKRVLSSLSPAALYVFDEVDSGVGGAVAAVIGQKLKQVAAHHQVLCITHLAQIAVFADAHFRVHKSVVQARTHSVIERLDADAQLEEVARMIGGLRISSKTRAAASEMLQGAR